MGLLYNATKWLDHVVQYPMRKKFIQNNDGTTDLLRAEGEIIQQGTPRNAANYNNLESGVLAASIFNSFLFQQILQLDRSVNEVKGEQGTVAITNTNNYPFTSPSVTISLAELRSNMDYSVEIEVAESDGNVEKILVFDKQLNGFKIAFKGSAKQATFNYKVIGGKC